MNRDNKATEAMYEELVQSTSRPFRATPDATFYFPHESMANVRQTVVRALQRAEGPTLVLGGAGLGKSLLAELVAADLGDRFDVVRLFSTRISSRRALLQNILFELGMPYRDLSEGELRLSILDRLEPSAERAQDGVLIIVDEAHTLPVKLLDELRLINNFSRHGLPRTRLALFGSLRLEDMFTDPVLESFSQRLAARCYLQPMNKRDTAEFVRHQLRVAGANPAQIVTHEALECVYAASEGVPRLANQVMDHALMLAIANCQSPISAALIEEAWSDLQQLPAPWHAGQERLAMPASPGSGHSIEFGALDHDQDWQEEEGSVPQETIGSNYFAAFSSLPIDADFADQAEGPHDGNVTDGNIDEEVEQDTAPDQSVINQANVAQTSPTTVVVDVTGPAEQETEEEIEQVCVPSENQIAVEPVLEKYFSGQVSDSELLAFEDEQQQYDSFGMWENDPPLAPLSAATGDIEPGDLASFESAHNWPNTRSVARPTEAPSSLFGSDFEEEIPVPARSTCLSTAPWVVLASEPVAESVLAVSAIRSGRPVADSSESTVDNDTVEQRDRAIASTSGNDTASRDASSRDASSRDASSRDASSRDAASCGPSMDQVPSEPSSAQFTQEVNDYVVRLQEYANAMCQVHSELARVEEVLAQPINSVPNVEEHWHIDTVGADDLCAINIARDIEDLVSQLNFSAFSVEPYSVEQIALQAPDSKSSVEDAVRSGDNNEVFVLHKAEELESRMMFNPTAVDYDDDRDLLIIEDEVPAGGKTSSEAGQEPPIKISPYNQLFARLRK